VLCSTLTMMSVLASVSAVSTIGLAPSAAATDGVPSALFSGYATGAHSTHIHHSRRVRTTPTATKHGSAQAVDSPAPVPLALQNADRPSACERVQTFHVDTQGHPFTSMGC
jgi:hypothetical protein